MSAAEFDVVVVELAAPPAGTPPDFRERVTLALKTTDERVLHDAELAYRGTFASTHEYVVRRMEERLPDDLRWLCRHCDPDVLRSHYENNRLIVWEIRTGSGVLVFESERETLTRAATLQRWNLRQTRPSCATDSCPCGAKDPEQLIIARQGGDFVAIGCEVCMPNDATAAT